MLCASSVSYTHLDVYKRQVLPSVWSENVRLDWELSNERIIINNKDLPGAVANNEYIVVDDDKHLPVERVSVLVVADNCDNDVIVTINTNGDWTNNTNVDMIYDKVIMGGYPKNYYDGTLEKIKFYGYNTKNSHMICIHEIEQCYVQKRLIFDDGG